MTSVEFIVTPFEHAIGNSCCYTMKQIRFYMARLRAELRVSGAVQNKPRQGSAEKDRARKGKEGRVGQCTACQSRTRKGRDDHWMAEHADHRATALHTFISL